MVRTRKELADWLIATCLLLGADISTAHIVAGTFIKDVVETDEGLVIR